MPVMDEEELAERHAEFFAGVCRFVYMKAFLHGLKHGKEGKK